MFDLSVDVLQLILSPRVRSNGGLRMSSSSDRHFLFYLKSVNGSSMVFYFSGRTSNNTHF